MDAMKLWLRISVWSLVLVCGFGAWASANDGAEDQITEEQVTTLVANTAADLAKDAAATLAKINVGEPPYKDKANPALYAFVYNTEVVMIAHPKESLVGKSFKGKPDVKGTMFRDLIVSGAIEHGTGWQDYLYQKPGETGIHPKRAYYKLIEGSDKVQYVVVAGMYGKQ